MSTGPFQTGDFQVGYEAFVAGNGYIVLKDWSTVVMTGEDRHSFLHNMCTNDIKRLQAGNVCEAFCTDVKGKIVAQVFVIARSDRLELLAVPEQAAGLIAHLDRYIIREDVTLTDASQELEWSLFSGKGVHDNLVANNATGLPGDWLLSYAAEKCIGVFKKFGESVIQCNQEAWEALRIEAGLPLYGVDFESAHLPQEVNRDDLAISFNKGCYLGQETVARIDALGHVNQKVVGVQFGGKELPAVGMELKSEDQIVGQVTSSCWSPKLQATTALAMVRRGSNELGKELECELGTATIVKFD